MIDPGLETSLRTFASGAAAKASELLQQGQPRAGAHAANWMRASREALEAARIADEPLSEGERGAFEQLVRHQREKISTAEQALAEVLQQRDDLAVFLGNLAGVFESADSPTAARHAARIRRELADVLTPGEHEAARDRLRARGVELPEDEDVPRPEAGRHA